MGIFMQKIWESHREKIIFAAVLVGLFLVFKYVLPLLVPFAVAGILTFLLYRPVCYLNRKLHIGKTFLTAGILLAVFLVLLVLIAAAGYQICEKACRLWLLQEQYVTLVQERAMQCCDTLEKGLHLRQGILREETSVWMEGAYDRLCEKIVPALPRSGIMCIKAGVSAGGFMLIVFLAAVLMVKEWTPALEERTPQRVRRFCRHVVHFLKVYLGAQLKILSVIWLICLLGLWAAGISGPVKVALLTAFLELLPFIGTGIILVPLMVFLLVKACYLKALILLITYVFCVIAREYLEPRFISEKTGISPLLTLAGIYVGMKVFGLYGIVAGPVYILFATLCYREIFTDVQIQ